MNSDSKCVICSNSKNNVDFIELKDVEQLVYYLMYIFPEFKCKNPNDFTITCTSCYTAIYSYFFVKKNTFSNYNPPQDLPLEEDENNIQKSDMSFGSICDICSNSKINTNTKFLEPKDVQKIIFCLKYIFPELIFKESYNNIMICTNCYFSIHSFFDLKITISNYNSQKSTSFKENYEYESKYITMSDSNMKSQFEEPKCITTTKDENGNKQKDESLLNITSCPLKNYLRESVSFSDDSDTEDHDYSNTSESNDSNTEEEIGEHISDLDNSIVYNKIKPRMKPFIKNNQDISYTIISSLKCLLCKNNFTEMDELKQHIGTHIDIDTLTCLACTKKFSNKDHLKRHSMVVHTDSIIYQCDMCNKKFHRKDSCKNHIKKHRENQCLICNTFFVGKNDFKIHLKIYPSCQKLQMKNNQDIGYTKRSNFKCLLCKNNFTEINELKQHMETHIDVDTLTCLACTKKYTRKDVLKTHSMVVHTDSNIYQCDICNKTYQSKKNCIDHIKIHRGIMENQCLICNKIFIQKSSLKDHLEKHTRSKK